ncbi:hypothetical protein DW917_10510 [Prevotella sp. AM42-24]|nr:hypothetical protein DW917_10510 [Prevotella sp. AM42-24]
MIGTHPNVGNIRTLLKKGMDYFMKTVSCSIHLLNPSKEECADYLNTMVRMNRQYLDDAGSDYQARKTVQQTIIMLQASAKFLKEE